MHTIIGMLALPLYLFIAFNGLYWAYDWYRGGLQRLAGMPVVSRAEPMEVPRKLLEDAAIERTWNAFLDSASNYGAVTLRIDGAHTGQVGINWLLVDAPHDRAFNRLVLGAATDAVLHNKPSVAEPPVQRLLADMLSLHNGRYFGPIDAVLVLIGALMLPVFVITGW